MSSNKPPINSVYVDYVDKVFDKTITQLSEQIDWTTDYMKGSASTTNKTDCNDADHTLVKNILEIAYIPIIYHFKIHYEETNNTSQTEPPTIDNIHVEPRISIDTEYTINTRQNQNRIIKKFDIAERENAYKYMFELAFGQLNTPLDKEDSENQTHVNIEGYDNTYETFNSPDSQWKIDFREKKIMLDISFITITTIKDGKMEVSILDNMIKGEKVGVSDLKNNSSPPSTTRPTSRKKSKSTKSTSSLPPVNLKGKQLLSPRS